MRFLLLLLAVPALGASWYVSPTGTAGGSGTLVSPWDLATALTNPVSVVAGDTIRMIGGTYTGTFTSSLLGTSGARITLRGYGNVSERAIIEGRLTIEGEWADYWGFEVCSYDVNRTSTNTGNPWTDITVQPGVYVSGSNNRLINLVIHDKVDYAIGHWSSATNSEIYGCLLYYNGFKDASRGNGQGIYAQNETGLKAIENCIIHDNYEAAMQLYGSGAAFVNGFLVRSNICFSSAGVGGVGVPNQFTVAGGAGVSNFVATWNVTYAATNCTTGNEFGGTTETNSSICLTNNRFHAFTWLQNCESLSSVGNVFSQRPSQNIMKLRSYQETVPGTWLFSGNSYFSDDGSGFQLAINGEVDGTNYSFTDWKSVTGLDADSTCVVGSPTNTEVLIFLNKYESGRAHVCILNWALSDNVTVDLSGVVRVGRPYVIKNAADYWASPVKQGVYSGGTVSLPMTNLTVAAAVGFTAPPATGPRFNTFIVYENGTVPMGVGISVRQ